MIMKDNNLNVSDLSEFFVEQPISGHFDSELPIEPTYLREFGKIWVEKLTTDANRHNPSRSIDV